MKLPLERESDGDNLYDADGDLIAFVFSGGNAGSILTAVNSHEMLVEALKVMIIGAAAVGVPHKEERKVLQESVDIAQAAIKQVEE